MADDLPVYPAILRLEGLRCLVVGGRALATRKALAPFCAGAEITVIAPMIDDDLQAMTTHVLERDYVTGDAAGYQLVFAATGIGTVDVAIAEDARRCGVFVNAADHLSASSFILPAIFRDGLVQIAVSTSGRSPALASYLREEIGAIFEGDAAFLAEIIGGVRDALHLRGLSSEGRDWRGLIAATLKARRSHGPEQARELCRDFTASWFGS